MWRWLLALVLLVGLANNPASASYYYHMQSGLKDLPGGQHTHTIKHHVAPKPRGQFTPTTPSGNEVVPSNLFCWNTISFVWQPCLSSFFAGGGSGGTSSAFSAAFPAMGTAAGMLGPASTMVPFVSDGGGTQLLVSDALVESRFATLNSTVATAANQTNASQKTMIVDGSGNVIASSGNALNVNCAVNCGVADTSTFTVNTTVGSPVDCFAQTTITSNPLSNLKAGTVQCGIYRQVYIGVIDSGGTDVSDATTHSIKTEPVAQEVHIGEVGGNMIVVTNAMTTTNATTTTGQSIGGLQTLANMVRVSGTLGNSGTTGLIQNVTVTFKDAVGAGPLDVYFFNANPSGSTCTNDSALVLADADRTKVIGIVHVTDFTASNTAAVGQAQNLALGYGLASATSAYACVVARASFVITGTANAALVVAALRN